MALAQTTKNAIGANQRLSTMALSLGSQRQTQVCRLGVKRKLARTRQRRFLQDQQAERARVNAHFDEELAKLRPLWAQQAGMPAEARK